jgi:hypothetical protein
MRVLLLAVLLYIVISSPTNCNGGLEGNSLEFEGDVDVLESVYHLLALIYSATINQSARCNVVRFTQVAPNPRSPRYKLLVPD